MPERTAEMLLMIGTIFVASLLGSLHCAGMCGAFVAIATGGIDATPRQKLITQLAYHLGRLATYTALGAIAGGVGALVDVAGRLAGIQTAAMAMAGCVMIGFGLISILRINGVKVATPKLPGAWQALVSGLHRRSLRFAAPTRAGLIGLLTTLLPCGWLYAFAVTAAGTGHPARGALTMAIFWLGTLPILVSLGIGAQTLLGSLGRRLPTVTCLLLIGVGVYTLAGRAHLDALTLATKASASETTEQPKPACCAAERS